MLESGSAGIPIEGGSGGEGLGEGGLDGEFGDAGGAGRRKSDGDEWIGFALGWVDWSSGAGDGFGCGFCPVPGVGYGSSGDGVGSGDGLGVGSGEGLGSGDELRSGDGDGVAEDGGAPGAAGFSGELTSGGSGCEPCAGGLATSSRSSS